MPARGTEASKSASPKSAGRRRLLSGAGWSVVGAVVGLGGCGFALRRAPPVPFRRVALQGFAPASPMARELRLALAGSSEVVEVAASADVVVVALVERLERSIVASTSTGQVRELQLRVRFSYRVLSGNGQERVPATEMLLLRDMTYQETDALAKELEEAALVRQMQVDMALQVLRRLSSLQP